MNQTMLTEVLEAILHQPAAMNAPAPGTIQRGAEDEEGAKLASELQMMTSRLEIAREEYSSRLRALTQERDELRTLLVSAQEVRHP